MAEARNMVLRSFARLPTYVRTRRREVLLFDDNDVAGDDDDAMMLPFLWCNVYRLPTLAHLLSRQAALRK